MRLTKDMEAYISASQDELRQLIRDLCAIPAPSHHEERRAAFCRDWFINNGMEGAYIDEALNAVCPYGVTDTNDITVFMAHTDTVFPDMEPMPLTEDGDMMYCPGIADDTANLAVLMLCARYVVTRRLPMSTGMLFVANSCEEGLGNLKGSRRIMADYGARVREFVTLDGGSFSGIVTGAVGSHRYRVTVRTEGGHSFGSFGKPNAIQKLAALISTLYTVDVPVEGDSRTTYNVGLISGGTSINTIAPQAEMCYEYRSDNVNCLRSMQDMFGKVIDAYRATGVDIDVELIGDRPCSNAVDPARQAALVGRMRDSLRDVLGLELSQGSGSTDANVPLSMGIPAMCIGVCRGGKGHTRAEWLDASSLPDGCRLFMDLLAGYCSSMSLT